MPGPTYGLLPSGFVAKSRAQILSDLQQGIWASPAIGPDLDLSPQTPDGQLLGVIADAIAAQWALLGEVHNQFSRELAQGMALDNLGDLVGIPREGQNYTQVFCNVSLDPAHAPYAAGSLLANVAGFPSQTFANVAAVPASAISLGVAQGILFQSTVIGPTPAVNPGTLTAITTPVPGWTAITNPNGQSQLGLGQEADSAYGPRQAQQIGVEGACNPSATAAAIEALGAAQSPPVTLIATVYENTTQSPVTIGGVTVLPNQYAVFVYEADASGWLAIGANQQLVGQTIWNNRPTGNLDVGSTSVTIQDPILGPQTVSFTIPVGVPIFISATVAIRPGQTWSTVAANIRNALIAAAVAPTPASGIPPAGQMLPGGYVIGSQLEAVIMSVPGVFDVQALTFDTHATPTNTAPILLTLAQVGTIASSTAGTNIVLTQGTAP